VAGDFAGWLLSGLRQVARSGLVWALSLCALGLAVTGLLRDLADLRLALAVLAGLGALIVHRLFERARKSVMASKSPALADAELGTLFVAAAFAVIEVTGGPSGLLYPLVYALLAFLVAYHGRVLALGFLTLIIGCETAIQLVQTAPEGWRLLASHTSFNLLFGLLYALFLRTEVSARERRVTHEVKGFLDGVEAEAREFRLSSGLSLSDRQISAEEMAKRRHVGSVRAIHDSLYNVLGVAERALAPHTVALFWLDAGGSKLKLKELRSASDHVTDKPLAAAEGFLGAITKRKEPLVLTSLRAGHAGLVYYERPEAVTDFAGVPVLEGPHLRGVLIADRKDGRAFDDSDVAVLGTLAQEINRTVQVERIFADMDRDKFQKERFYEASREFNKTRKAREVAEQAIIAARRVAQVEFAAVTVSLERENRQRLEAVDWVGHTKEAEALVGREFNAEEGLVGSAIKARHPLPVGTSRSATQAILSPMIHLPLAGVKVVPLIWQDQGVGSLVLASPREDFLAHDMLDMLRVIADHAAIALANAQMNESIERMATTDGLTGLVNHRDFQRRFDEQIGAAERYGRKLSLIFTDIDHFKSVNDTYGHPVGDIVLKRVANILGATARRIDLVARYGGEEFAILMESDRPGARQTAERIRLAVAAETFRCEQGTFRSSISLGIATFPEDGTTKAKLTESADQALYAAKHQGRNRIVVYDSLKPKREAISSA